MNPLDEKLTQFVSDDVMFNTVKGAILSQCDLNSIEKNMPNIYLGETAKAWLQAREIIEHGFREIEKYKKQTREKKDSMNPAV